MAMSLHRVTLSCPSHLSWLQFPINWGWTELSPQSFPDLTMCDSSWDEAISPSSSLLEALLLSFHKLTKTHTHTSRHTHTLTYTCIHNTYTPTISHVFTLTYILTYTQTHTHYYTIKCTYTLTQTPPFSLSPSLLLTVYQMTV